MLCKTQTRHYTHKTVLLKPPIGAKRVSWHVYMLADGVIFLFFILLSAEKKISSYNNWLSQRCAHYMWSHSIIILNSIPVLITVLIIHPLTCGLILLSFSAEVCPLNVVSYYYHSQFHTNPHYCINDTPFDKLTYT